MKFSIEEYLNQISSSGPEYKSTYYWIVDFLVGRFFFQQSLGPESINLFNRRIPKKINKFRKGQIALTIIVKMIIGLISRYHLVVKSEYIPPEIGRMLLTREIPLMMVCSKLALVKSRIKPVLKYYVMKM